MPKTERNSFMFARLQNCLTTAQKSYLQEKFLRQNKELYICFLEKSNEVVKCVETIYATPIYAIRFMP